MIFASIFSSVLLKKFIRILINWKFLFIPYNTLFLPLYVLDSTSGVLLSASSESHDGEEEPLQILVSGIFPLQYLIIQRNKSANEIVNNNAGFRTENYGHAWSSCNWGRISDVLPLVQNQNTFIFDGGKQLRVGCNGRNYK